jgi:hypothetical protein
MQMTRKEEYLRYLASPEWKIVKTKVHERDGWRCVLCNSPHELQAHHRSYRHFKDEINHLCDVMTVCRKCHEKHHNVHAQAGPATKTNTVEPIHENQYQEPPVTVTKSAPVPASAASMNVSAPGVWPFIGHKVMGIQAKAGYHPMNNLVWVRPENHHRIGIWAGPYHWAKHIGIDPTKKGWRERMIGHKIPQEYMTRP